MMRKPVIPPLKGRTFFQPNVKYCAENPEEKTIEKSDWSPTCTEEKPPRVLVQNRTVDTFQEQNFKVNFKNFFLISLNKS